MKFVKRIDVVVLLSGMMWSGLEPSEGQVNETYHQIISQTVDGLAGTLAMWNRIDEFVVNLACYYVSHLLVSSFN